ncbi:MAG: aminotransferase class V-fold PLP-dependent enzyme [Burkholderiaceae bacterium]|nr:aminotransferase class V-fold PLP-dependent enzyme [Microbacteriaceae bacterium]
MTYPARSSVRSTAPAASAALASARASFGDTHGYLAAAAMGVPTRESVAAQKADLDDCARAARSPRDYEGAIERSRAHYAALVGVDVDRVAIGSQTSVMASVIAAAVPPGAEVLCVDGDFTSIVFPFLQAPAVRVRHVPLEDLAASITDATWLVAFSHIQSATGRVADVVSIATAAAAHGAFTLCDTTQSAGVHPVDAAAFDATVCHAYKWLCAPRGAAFLTVTAQFQERLTPVQAGWCAGADVWQSCYGPEMRLAATARRFDVSPAWSAWVGAEHPLQMFASLDIDEVWRYASGLGDELCDARGIPRQHQAIVTWADPEGHDLARLTNAGIRASWRAGRLRAAFHLWNDASDVVAVVNALR